MKNRTKTIVFVTVAVLAVLVCLFALLHNSNRTEVPEGSLTVTCNGTTDYFTQDDIAKDTVVGTIVNGKGEENKISATGVCLNILLEQYKFDTCKVVSDDEYSAVIKSDELENAYITIDGEAFRLYVFGDKNSKRNVKNVVKLELE